MLALAIDTSTEVCSTALGRDGAVLDEDVFHAGRMHLEMLLPRVHGILESQALAVRDLDMVIVGIGPGTFSGLRIGIATARGLSQAMQVPLLGADSLRALAYGISETDKDAEYILPVIDAKRGQVFSQLFHRNGNGLLEATTAVSGTEPQTLVTNISSVPDRPIVTAGNGVVAYYPVFSAAPMIRPLAIDHPAQDIRAAFHLTVGSRETDKEFYSLDDLSRILPMYIREPDADNTVLQRKREPWLR